MNHKAYAEGVASVSRSEDIRVHVLENAIKECHERGWSYLESYFTGRLDAAQAARGKVPNNQASVPTDTIAQERGIGRGSET